MKIKKDGMYHFISDITLANKVDTLTQHVARLFLNNSEISILSNQSNDTMSNIRLDYICECKKSDEIHLEIEESHVIDDGNVDKLNLCHKLINALFSQEIFYTKIWSKPVVLIHTDDISCYPV